MQEETLRWLRDNRQFTIAVGCLVLALLFVGWAIVDRRDHNPHFVCDNGEHFEARIIDGVATLACFSTNDPKGALQ